MKGVWYYENNSIADAFRAIDTRLGLQSNFAGEKFITFRTSTQF
jgi:hypothetical protein